MVSQASATKCVLSSFAIILKKKRELVALLWLSSWCLMTVCVLRLSLTVPWGLQGVIVVFPDHTYLLFIGMVSSIIA